MNAVRFAGLIVVLWTLAPASTPAASVQWQERESWSGIVSEAGLEGRAVIFDEAGQAWLVHDKGRAERAYSPASTFKATLIKWRNRHGIQKVRRPCCVVK